MFRSLLDRSLGLGVALVCGATASFAQCADWSTNFAAPTAGNGLNARAYDMVRWNDGSGEQLYVAGDFTQAGSTAASRIAAWDGTTWSALGSGMNGSVFCLLDVYPNSGPGAGLFAGGNFTTAGGTSAASIARWNGSSWSALGTGINGEVYALCLFNDGNGFALYAAGMFTLAGGTSASNIAKWDGTTWSALGLGTSGGGYGGRIDTLAAFNDGNGYALFAGGWFSTAGTANANLVAKWNGFGWSQVGDSANYLSGTNVYDLCVYDADGSANSYWPRLYAGGNFTSATNNNNTASIGNVASWNGSGWWNLDFTPLRGVDSVVRDLHVFDDGTGYGETLFATGHFINAGDFGASFIAEYDLSGWYALGTGLGGGIGLCLGDYDDGAGGGNDLYAGGIFSTAGGNASSYFAEWRGCNGAQFPMQNGELVVTCQNQPTDDFVVRVIDPRNPWLYTDTNWPAPQFHNEFNSNPNDDWTVQNLGCVFGVTLDDAAAPSIYVAASALYYTAAGGPSGDGAIYELDGTTGAISTLATLPNTGPALGDICYDRLHVLNKGFYVSNFEDGKIYHLDQAGTVLGTFDPFAPDDGAAGYAPLGERVWAVQLYNTRELYFSVWLADDARQSPAWPASWPPQGTNLPNNAIFKVGLAPTTGAFVGPAKFVKSMPYLYGYYYSNPVADIAFNFNNRRLLCAERSMVGDGFSSSAGSRVIEWTGGGPGNLSNNWAPFLPGEYWTGKFYKESNADGGADYDCDDDVFATVDFMHMGSSTGDIDSIFGVQCIPSGGNTMTTPTTTSRLIDLDGDIASLGVGQWRQGDLEVCRPTCSYNWYDFCTPKTNSQGCAPHISAQGETSVASPIGLTIQCSDVLNNKSGLIFYGFSGAHDGAFQGGTLCVHPPLSRGPLQNSGGNPGPDDCSGSFSINMNQFASGALGGNPNPNLALPGTTVDCQWWSRDAAFAPPNNTSLSDALEYVIEP